MKQIVVQSKKCIECHLCQLVCSLSKSGIIDLKASAVRISEGAEASLLICLQCGHKMCQEVCLRKAIEISDIGAVIIDKDKCDGCGKCIGACNNHAIVLEAEEGPVRVCDLCGGLPNCVAVCPTGALKYEEIDDFREDKIAETGHKLIEGLIEAMGRK